MHIMLIWFNNLISRPYWPTFIILYDWWLKIMIEFNDERKTWQSVISTRCKWLPTLRIVSVRSKWIKMKKGRVSCLMIYIHNVIGFRIIPETPWTHKIGTDDPMTDHVTRINVSFNSFNSEHSLLCSLQTGTYRQTKCISSRSACSNWIYSMAARLLIKCD